MEVIEITDDEIAEPPCKIKKTARKAVSSFTCKDQRKKIRPIMVTVDSDEEQDKPVDKNTNGTKDDQVKNGSPEPVSAAIDNVLSCCKNSITEIELQKVSAKLEKRKGKITNLHNLSLAAMLDQKAAQIKANPKLVFRHLKIILDELSKYAAKNEKNGKVDPEPCKSESKERLESSLKDEDEDDEEVRKRKKHIKRLEVALKQCGDEIARLDEAEMNLDDLDDEDSNYLKITRYQKRYMKIYKKIAQLKKLNSSLKLKCNQRMKIETSRIPEVNRLIEQLVNKKKQFPDFADVHGFYKAINEEKNLGMTKDLLKHDGKSIFCFIF